MSEVQEHIENLKNYVRIDRENIRHGQCKSDYEKFCEGHCRDIEFLICAYENVERELLARDSK